MKLEAKREYFGMNFKQTFARLFDDAKRGNIVNRAADFGVENGLWTLESRMVLESVVCCFGRSWSWCWIR